jgi:hypothetical protein
MHRGHAAAWAIALAVVVSIGAHVRADDAAESRFFDGIARDAYAHRHYPEALEAFLRAYRAAPSSRALYNIGLCAQLAHRDAMAFAYYEEFLAATDADPGLRSDATTRHDALARTLALVRVESDPPGAEIFADQRDHGSLGHTPRTIALTPGAHHLELALADHADGAADVTATAGESHDVHTTLTAFTGTLTIHASASGATIVARNGAGEHTVTADAASALPVGHYTVTASAPGHRDASVEVQIVRDASEQRTLTLEVIPAPTGGLLVTTGDVHARVRVDGTDRAETPARVAALAVGTHEIAISADGYLDWHGSVDVAQDRTAFVSVTLTRAR